MKITKNIFPLEWKITDPLQVPYHGTKVFGTFVCGGGSTMGYKLAGYEHIGGVEFTEHYSRAYRANHKPRYFYEQDIRTFNESQDLPSELYDLDLLDGSPPCAAFSSAGAGERLWNKKSSYENTSQRKDDLVFVYLETVAKLRPKVFLLENVQGLIKGNAKAYAKEIVKLGEGMGYKVQLFCLNAASMGLPQIRTRVFFIGLRNDFDLPKLQMDFDCPLVGFGVTRKYWNNGGYDISHLAIGREYDNTAVGGNSAKFFNLFKPHPKKPCFTITEASSNPTAASVVHPFQKRKLNLDEVRLLSTFPLDYDFAGNNPVSVMGRSVLPCMMANVSHQIFLQWLSKLKPD